MASRGFRIGDWISDGTQLGVGSFATVYLGHRVDTPSQTVAIKVIDLKRLLSGSDNKAYEMLASEIKHQVSCKSPHTVPLYEVLTNTDTLYLIMELCWGDLSKLLRQSGGKFSEAVTQRFMRHLAFGLETLREQKVIHRDLKPQNLLITFPDPQNLDPMTAVLKISDFGFARVLDEGSVTGTLCGSPLYMAPEILLVMEYTPAIDMYSAGAIMFEMLTGRAPYPCKSLKEIYEAHRAEQKTAIKFPDELLQNCSPSCLNLLSGLLEKAHHRRTTLVEMLEHPWIQTEIGQSQIEQPKIPEEVIEALRRIEGLLPNQDSSSPGSLFEHPEKLTGEKLDLFVSKITSLADSLASLRALVQKQGPEMSEMSLRIEEQKKRIADYTEKISLMEQNLHRPRIIIKNLRVGDDVMFFKSPKTDVYEAYGKHGCPHILSEVSLSDYNDQVTRGNVIIGTAIATDTNLLTHDSRLGPAGSKIVSVTLKPPH